MERRIYFVISLYLLCFFHSYSQVPFSPEKNLTPTAASLQRYGTIPVSLYTGTPQIVIPLDTVFSKGIRIPISLSYHSGGIKVETHPDCTGLGWTLMCGGAITRQVNGFPDETNNEGFFYRHSLMKGITKETAHFFFSTDGYWLIDTQPDIFHFNFMGYNGFFMMDTDGNWQVCCDRPIKVKSCNIGKAPMSLANGEEVEHAGNMITGFTLECGDGSTYEFGCQNNNENDMWGGLDMSIGMSSRATKSWTADAWYLRKIPLASGQSIEFRYRRGKFNVNIQKFSYHSYTPDYSFVSSSNGGATLISPVSLEAVLGPDFSVSLYHSKSKDLCYTQQDILEWMHDSSTPGVINMKYFKGTTKDIIEQIEWQKLDQIIIYRPDYPYKKFNFEYDENANRRLTLQNLKILSNNNVCMQKYSFSYNKAASLPPYLSGEEDHWGYFNGAHTENDMYARHQPDPDKTLYGLLTDIHYPTGGWTHFDFEPNQYTLVNSLSASFMQRDTLESVPLQLAGGARIKRIFDYASDDSPVVKREFKYITNDTDSSACGILEGLPIYSYEIPATKTVRIESSRPISSVINNHGFHISYPCVMELYADNSYYVNHFISLLDKDHRDESPVACSNFPAFIPHSVNAALRGQIKETNAYNSSGRKLTSSVLEYEMHANNTPDSILMFDLTSNALPAVGYNQTLVTPIFSLYKQNLKLMRPVRSTLITFDSNSSAKKTTSSFYRYNKYGQLSCDSIVYTIGATTHNDVIHYGYNWEKQEVRTLTGQENLEERVIEPPVVKSLFRNGHLLHKEYRYYNYNYGALLNDGLEMSYPDGKREIINMVARRDKYGNPVLTYDKSGMPTIFLWDKDYRSPIAEIRNVEPRSLQHYLNYRIEEAPLIPDIEAKKDLLRYVFPRGFITTYDYDVLGRIIGKTDPDGVRLNFLYSSSGALSAVLDSEGHVIESYSYNYETTEY